MPNGKNYVIDKTVNYSIEDGKWTFGVEWYGLASFDDKRVPVEGLPCTKIIMYLKKVHKVKWSVHAVMGKTVVG